MARQVEEKDTTIYEEPNEQGQAVLVQSRDAEVEQYGGFLVDR